MSESKGVALIVGAGEGTGGAIARRFARAGHPAAVVRRNEAQLGALVSQIESDGGKACAFGIDARDEDQVRELFERVETEMGPIEIVVYNAAIGAFASVVDMKAETFRALWETDCFAAFLVGREAARRMLPRESGSIFFTGNTAATRGKAGFSAFAAAKHGQRALAQSLARELGPRGIHVAHLIIDGPIDGEFVRNNLADLVADRPDDGILSPDDIAENYFALHSQARSAWTFELDMRPWVEPW
jgi:NAD(P)-dependent dehydrogenase (short-subunit alcohol dehydrogenase family)